MSPMQQVKAKMKQHGGASPSDQYQGYGSAAMGSPPPGGKIPKEVLAQMQGGSSGRRNIKIRAVRQTGDPHDVVDNDIL